MLTMLSRYVLPVLTIGITIPLWLILAGGLWLHLDRSSAVRQAVDRAVSDLVRSSELEAAAAREEALQKILADRERQADRDRAALARFADLLSSANAERDSLHDEIAELDSMPAPDTCTVDSALLERLRNAR